MLEQIEGSQAVARAVGAARPQVVCAYPITPQTHIVEALGRMVRSGDLQACSFLNVESEFAALSVCIGAAAAGSRTYTATASQGLLYMTEAVYNAAGLDLPIVMTVANRAVGAPINIWNDHSDAMALRDAGWIQLYAADNQQAVDLHPLAFRLAEEASVPVMVCMDGFALTHAVERVDVPGPDLVDAFLPPPDPAVRLDPDRPLTIGAMVGPDAFTEVRYLAADRFRRAADLIPVLAAEWERLAGRPLDALLRPYRMGDATTVAVTMGSVHGTLCEAVDRSRDQGHRVGALAVTAYRPFPDRALREALAGARRVVVVDRAVTPAGQGFLHGDLLPVLDRDTEVLDVVAGLGGRPVTAESLTAMLDAARSGRLPPVTFLDLDREVAERELGRPAVTA